MATTLLARSRLGPASDEGLSDDAITDGVAAVHCIHTDILVWLRELAAAAAPAESNDPRLTWTIEEAAVRAGISRTSAYLAAETGELPARRVGDRWIVPRLTFLLWLLTGDVGAADLSRLITSAIRGGATSTPPASPSAPMAPERSPAL